MPPTDPRVLEADEGAILRDLLVRMYHAHEQRKSWDPKGAAAALADSAPESLREQFQALEREVKEGEFSRLIQQFEAARRPVIRKRTLTGIKLRVGTKEPPKATRTDADTAVRLMRIKTTPTGG